MQRNLAPTFNATPHGITIDGMSLNKFASRKLSPETLRYIKRAEELLATVKKEDWDNRTPHATHDVPALAKAQMMLALASPHPFGKYSAEQPRVPAGNPDGGQWTIGNNANAPLKDPKNYIGKPTYKNKQGNAECVEFAQQAGGLPLTRYWTPGDFISSSNPPPVGTWVATFVDGKYYGHVGAFYGYDEDGTLSLIDQYNKKDTIGITYYHLKPAGYSGHISNDPSQYRIVKW